MKKYFTNTYLHKHECTCTHVPQQAHTMHNDSMFQKSVSWVQASTPPKKNISSGCTAEAPYLPSAARSLPGPRCQRPASQSRRTSKRTASAVNSSGIIASYTILAVLPCIHAYKTCTANKLKHTILSQNHWKLKKIARAFGTPKFGNLPVVVTVIAGTATKC